MPTCLGTTNITGNFTISGELDTTTMSLNVRNILMPVGSIITYAVNSPPAGFLICDGAAVSRTVYSDLFSVIGTNFGTGNGVSTFNLPNINGKFIMGCDSSHAYATTGGQTDISLTQQQLPAHQHIVTVSDPGHTHNVTDSGHTHNITDNGHTHSYNDTVWSEYQSGGSNNQIGNNDNTDYDNTSHFVSRTTGSASTGISVNNNTSGVTVNGGTTGITATTSNTGSGSTIDITNPYIALYYIIKY